MDLWIRSQDKKRLIPNPNLYAVYSKEMNKAYIGDTIVGHIAEYSTEERALEVLDEIQEAKLGNFHYKCPSNVKVSFKEDTIVYEMPKE